MNPRRKLRSPHAIALYDFYLLHQQQPMPAVRFLKEVEEQYQPEAFEPVESVVVFTHLILLFEYHQVSVSELSDMDIPVDAHLRWQHGVRCPTDPARQRVVIEGLAQLLRTRANVHA